MAAKIFKLANLWMAQEAAWMTDPSANGAGYTWVRAGGIAFKPGKNVVERDLDGTLARLKHVVGGKNGTLAFQLELKGSGTPGTAACVDPEAHLVLEAIFGSAVNGVGTTVNDMSASTTAFDVTSAAGLQLGMMVLVNCGAPYGYVARFITAIAGSEITLNRALPAAPANAAVVQASTVYKRTDTGHKSMAFVGKRDDILYTFLGCKLESVTIESIEAEAITRLNFNFEVSDWNTDAKGSLPAATPAGVTLVTPPVVKGGCFARDGVEELMYSMSFDFGLTFAFQDSTCSQGPATSDSTKAGMALTLSRPTAAVKVYYGTDHMVDFAAGTENAIEIQVGDASGNAWGIYAPKTQMTDVEPEDKDGMVGEALSIAVNENGSSFEWALSLA